MAFGFDGIFGMHETALYLRSRRAELLASNLANADTPNYKARDIDFRAALANANTDAAGTASRGAGAGPRGPLAVTDTRHLQPGGSFLGAETLYREPLQASIDGNTVEPQVEMAEFMDNAVRYQATLRFINGKVKGLLTAIRGD